MSTPQQGRVDTIEDRIAERLAVRHQHVCGGCELPVPGKHLRVNFANPDKPWHAMRFHDLLCLLDFLEDEEAGQGSLFSEPGWVDSSLSPS